MVRPANLAHTPLTGISATLAASVEKPLFTHFITAVILINAVILGFETDAGIMRRYGDILHLLDHIALGIFAVELVLKLIAYRLSFFRAGWNVFDFVIVVIALVPASGPLAVLRALRVLRVLRLVSVVPSMRRVISALLTAIPGMTSIMAVLMIIYYVSAVLATKLFSGHPDPQIAAQFESIAATMYTLFQIMTLEGWSQEIVRPVMDVYPLAWLFFIPFIIITSFAVLNLFIGIIVDAISTIHVEEGKESEAAKLAKIEAELAEIKALLKSE
ncbi:MAG: ion transporter [Bdellovibrionales bacterium]